MGDRWPPLSEFMGLAVGALIIVSVAIGVIFLAQTLGASSYLLIAIGGVVLIAAAFVIGRALSS
jgi:hypothetical protein